MSARNKVITKPRKSDSSTASNTNTKATSSLDQEYLEIQRELVYGKYLEAKFQERYLRKRNAQIKASWDLQLAQKSEEIEAKKEEIEKTRVKMNQIPAYTQLIQNTIINEDLLTKNLEQLNTGNADILRKQIENISNKVYMDGLTLKEADQDQLEQVIDKIKDITTQTKEKSNPEYCNLIDKIKQIEEVSRKINKCQKEVSTNIETNNALVLKVCSLKLSEEKEE